jgi:hypothetical protein
MTNMNVQSVPESCKYSDCYVTLENQMVSRKSMFYKQLNNMNQKKKREKCQKTFW